MKSYTNSTNKKQVNHKALKEAKSRFEKMIREADASAGKKKSGGLTWYGKPYKLKLIVEQDESGKEIYIPLPVLPQGQGAVSAPENEYLKASDGTIFDFAFPLQETITWAGYYFGGGTPGGEEGTDPENLHTVDTVDSSQLTRENVSNLFTGKKAAPVSKRKLELDKEEPPEEGSPSTLPSTSRAGSAPKPGKSPEEPEPVKDSKILNTKAFVNFIMERLKKKL